MSTFYVLTMFAPVLCSLFYTFPPPFDKAEPSMAFAEQLSWHRHRERISASPMISESQFTVSQHLNPLEFENDNL